MKNKEVSPKKYFGTDGIRGRVGESLISAEFILKLGWAVGKVLAQEDPATVLIGKDTRISGYMIESALLAGLSAAGVNIKILGPMPTPAIAYLTQSVRASAGIVISASHNLYEDNGVKFFDKEGYKLSDEMELAIENKIDEPMKTVSSDRLGRASRMVDAPGRYIEFCKSTFPADLNLKGLKIIVDCAHGSTYYVAPHIFHELGAQVTAIGNTPNGFNINQHCGSTHTEALIKKVIETQAHIGIAFDGDGDRVLMVDEKGEFVDGDEILCILAKDYLSRSQSFKKFGIVGTVMSNLGLEEALKSDNIPFERVSVGDRNVLERLLQKNWFLGGEASGHIVDLSYTTTGDGMITALQILRIMQKEKKSLHELKHTMTKCPQVLINVPTLKMVDLAQYPKIHEAVTRAEQKLNGNGRILLRSSGTEPLIRVMVEGSDSKLINETAQMLAGIVESALNPKNF